MAIEHASIIGCAACGRKHQVKESSAGKPFRCACGSVVLAPTRSAAADQALLDLDNDYDLADEPREAMPVQPPKLKVPMKAPTTNAPTAKAPMTKAPTT